VGTLTSEEWQYCINELRKDCEIYSSSRRTFKLPSHFSKNLPFLCTRETFKWEKEYRFTKKSFPSLRTGECWHKTKWITEDLGLWRAELLDFALTWNSYTHSVLVSFQYNVQVFDYEEDNWKDQ